MNNKILRLLFPIHKHKETKKKKPKNIIGGLSQHCMTAFAWSACKKTKVDVRMMEDVNGHLGHVDVNGRTGGC